MTANGLQIAEGGNFGAENFNFKQMYNRSKNVHLTTDLPLLAICCYVPFFFKVVKFDHFKYGEIATIKKYE